MDSEQCRFFALSISIWAVVNFNLGRCVETKGYWMHKAQDITRRKNEEEAFVQQWTGNGCPQ
jgi:hypothetical protein